MTQYHEPPEELDPTQRDLVRAWASIKEEIEAIYWYQQRAATCADEELRTILVHNRDEEIEHAVMALEWCRRRIPKLDEVLRTYLFTTGSVVELEEAMEGTDDDQGETGGSGDLGVGAGD